MSSYSIQQRVQTVELFYENWRSVEDVFRKLRDFMVDDHPSERIELLENFRRLVR